MSAAASASTSPAFALLARYAAVLKAAWAARHALAGPKRLADEQAFLPAALSLQDTPVHPAPRRLAITLCALFVIALAWAIFGRIDIVAVASGRIVVGERTKTLQPLEAAVVKRVLVKDGDAVQAGQVLVELDATNASADGISVQEQLASAVSEERRTTALLAALRAGRLAPSPASAGEGWGEGHKPHDQAQLHAEWQDLTAKLSKLAAERARREAEAATVHELIAKLEATLPIARQREADLQKLADQGFMSSHAVQDRSRERIEQERDLATQRARLAEAQAALHETERTRAAYLAETQRTLSERQAQAALKRQQLTQERSKAEQRSRLTQLTAPVAGTVQQVAVHTEGGVVTPAQVLMVIVPKDAEVTAEVVIDNKDIGFVRAGQDVTVKLETFPFTRYGTVPATVKSVTADAVADEKRGAIFPATLTLNRSSIDVDGKRVSLSPGMNVTVEIKTGRRQVIDYLLDPIHRTASESLRER
ncbi:MAG TPA: HlyD family type I secretion periplasmic adaptor subunit [Methylibium sp.]|uniref:HlyD family type I secretion periplasmic adaptor subunit n=1 Tax=Methylibium sp. TaxID=2067992 RepID=UPI002DBC3134|nr:HlyD family type I secretion periplasmic adaptor subunit [Methylibium sp.]HEU4458066.1 HlyD family type I secretion periplasmic adaptor subunit [Methylibium sp.]